MKAFSFLLGFFFAILLIIACKNNNSKISNVTIITDSIINISKAEQDIVDLFELATKTAADYDETIKVFNTIEKKLNELLQNPSSINYAFNLLRQQGVEIITSDDLKFRVFSWDDLSGGSMRAYTNVYQYFDGTNTLVTTHNNLVEVDSVWTSNFTQIYSIKNKKGVHYLIIGKQATGGASLLEILQIVSPQNGKLDFNEALINVDGKMQSTITSFNENVDFEIDEPLINYNSNTKVITQIVKNEDGTEAKKQFTFNGMFFK